MPTNKGDEALTQVHTWLHTYTGDDVSVAGLLCDRHADGSGRIALQYEDATGNQSRLSFDELSEHSSRFAGVLRDLGIGPGDRVATLLPKTPELLITTLAIWRLGAVHVPLFTAFGPQAIAYRVVDSSTSVLVTNATYRPRVEASATGPTGENGSRAPLRIVTVESSAPVGPSDVPFWDSLRQSAPLTPPVSIRGDDLIILIYTSGTTGNPKGVEVPARALASFEAYMRFGYDLRPDDVYWNIADPGWAYGLYYALIGPLLCGNTTLFLDAPFDADRVYQTFERYGVTNFAAAPTVYRALRAAGQREGLRDRLHVRNMSSAGEPLNPDVITWAREQLGVPIFDHYGQSEHGMLVNNHHARALQRLVQPGSMGHPMPGFRVVIVGDDSREIAPGQEGQLAVDIHESPLYWFRSYYNAPDRTAERFSTDGRYYLSGDAASCDADGYFFFSGRADDVITSAGYRIGPFEVESALVAHPAVAEAAAVGAPDPIKGEFVKAYVVLTPGRQPSDALAHELGQFVKTSLSAHMYPREIEFLEQLPKTPSGKIQRFLLRDREQPPNASTVR